MKNELHKGKRFTSIGEVIAVVASAVDFYNNERPHMSIDMMTPAVAALCEGEISKRWVSHREEAIKNKDLDIPERDKTWETTKNRDNDESQPISVITLNQSQLLLGRDSF